MLSFNQHFAALLDEQVDKRIRALEEELAAGSAEDYAEYRHKCGVIHGLRFIVVISDEVQAKLKEV